MNEEDVQQLRDLLRIHTRRLYTLEKQAAEFGLNTPPHILAEIEDIQDKISRIDRQIETNTLTSLDDGRNAIKQLRGSIDDVAHHLQGVEIRESQVFRLFGIPILTVSKVVSRVLLTLFIIFSIGFASFVLGAFTSFNQTAGRIATAEAAQGTAEVAQATLIAQASAEANARATAEAAQASAQANAQATATAEVEAAVAAQRTEEADAALRATSEAQARAATSQAQAAIQATLDAQATQATTMPTPTFTPTPTP